MAITVDAGDLAGLERAILEEVRSSTRKRVADKLTGLRAEIAQVIRRNLMASPTMKSLSSGELREQLGLGTQSSLGGGVDGDKAAEAIVSALVDDFIIDFLPTQDGALRLTIAPSMDELLALDEAEYVSNNKRGQSSRVPWLSWLLRSGRGKVTEADLVSYFRIYAVSRTGRMLMRRTGRGGPGTGKFGASRKAEGTGNVGPGTQGWSIPSEHAGTEDDNFITRALLPAVSELAALMEKAVELALK